MPSDNTTPHGANDYDVHIHHTIPYYQSFHQETVNLIKASGNEPARWLDTGCGTGSLVKMALMEFPQTQFILGDPSSGMLKVAKDKLSQHSLERIEFLEPLTTQQLSPHICQKVDVITAIQSHHYLSPEDRKKAIIACYNILNVNGLFITFENIRPLTTLGVKIGKKYWKNFQTSHNRDDETVQNHITRFDTEYFPITIEEHLVLLREAGFRYVELFWFSYMQAGFYCIR